MIFTIILVIIFICVISILNNKTKLAKSFEEEKHKLIKYAESLPEMIPEFKLLLNYEMHQTATGKYEKYILLPEDIKNETDFHNAFDALIEKESDYNRKRDVFKVNLCAHYMIKYFTKLIIQYGTEREKAIYYNNVKLLKINKLID